METNLCRMHSEKATTSVLQLRDYCYSPCVPTSAQEKIRPRTAQASKPWISLWDSVKTMMQRGVFFTLSFPGAMSKIGDPLVFLWSLLFLSAGCAIHSGKEFWEWTCSTSCWFHHWNCQGCREMLLEGPFSSLAICFWATPALLLVFLSPPLFEYKTCKAIYLCNNTIKEK